jgi:copper chaperone CopZ
MRAMSCCPFWVYQGHTDRYSVGPKPNERKEPTVADVHLYISRPAQKEGAALEDLEEALRKLDHVTDVDVNSAGNVVAVSFEGGKAEQESITRSVEEAGYEVSRLSVRSTFAEEDRNLWDI